MLMNDLILFDLQRSGNAELLQIHRSGDVVVYAFYAVTKELGSNTCDVSTCDAHWDSRCGEEAQVSAA